MLNPDPESDSEDSEPDDPDDPEIPSPEMDDVKGQRAQLHLKLYHCLLNRQNTLRNDP